MKNLKAQISELNDLADSLGEPLRLHLEDGGDAVGFRIDVAGRAESFVIHITDGPMLILCTTNDSLDLSSVAERLVDGGTLGRALSLLGRRLSIDLDWTLETEHGGNAGGSDMSSDIEMIDGDGHGGGGDGMAAYDDDDDDDDTLREWSQRLVSLEAIEAKAEEESQSSTAAADHVDRQIFDPRAAFRRLVNEFEEIFKAQDFDLVADTPTPQGLFVWEVGLAGFRPDSPLAQDLVQAGRRFGTSAVHLHITFKRGLHPFYPPSVVVTSPRFHGPIVAGVACHPMFTMDGWDFTTSACDFILRVKDFLQDHARVDFDAPQRETLPVERLLYRLQSLTGTRAADEECAPDRVYAAAYRAYIEARKHGSESEAGGDGDEGGVDDEARVAKKQRQQQEHKDTAATKGTAAKKKAVAWNAGTGYGYGEKGGPAWDARRAQQVQAARDAEARSVLEALAVEITSALSPEQSLEQQQQENSSSPSSDRATLLQVLRRSCLVPLLFRELTSIGLHGMTGRAPYYRSLLKCVEALSSTTDAAMMLLWRPSEDASSSLATLVAALRAQAARYVQMMGERSRESEEDTSDFELADEVIRVADKAAAAIAAAGRHRSMQPSTRLAGASAPSPSPSSPPPPPGGRVTRRQAAAAVATPSSSPEALYCDTLSQYRVRLISGVAANHVYRNNAAREPTAPTRARARRVATELASLEVDLPITLSSSVFVAADEQQTVLWKALITGPDDTPYAGGCFVFDVYFGSDYPNTPPLVSLRTTGNGTVRFNPNLYNCGKVCLSLLGTWSGEKGEQWHPDYSTVLQVLVSIQSLILVDNPYYNEPGYESRPDDDRSTAYNANIMHQTLRWAVLDQLQSPPAAFAEVVREHFRLQKEKTIETARRFEAYCRRAKQTQHAAAIAALIPKIQAALDKL